MPLIWDELYHFQAVARGLILTQKNGHGEGLWDVLLSIRSFNCMGWRWSEINFEKEIENLIELFGELVMDAEVC